MDGPLAHSRITKACHCQKQHHNTCSLNESLYGKTSHQISLLAGIEVSVLNHMQSSNQCIHSHHIQSTVSVHIKHNLQKNMYSYQTQSIEPKILFKQKV